MLKEILKKKIVIVILKYTLNLILIPIILYLKYRKILIIGRIDGGIGDCLLITSILPHIKNKKIYIITHNPVLFKNNPYIKKNIDIRNYSKVTRLLLILIFKLSMTENILGFYFLYKNNIFLQTLAKKYPKKYHLRDFYLLGTKYFKLSYNKKLNNELYFAEDEEKKFEYKFKNIINKKFNLIQSQSNMEYIKIKDWGFENMQKVVDKTSKNIRWIQIGINVDKKLDNTYLDLRNKITIRELAFIIKYANLILCNEGLYTHMSSCFNTRCITIFTGYQHKSISNYENIISIEPSKKLDCLYCWENIGCPLYKNPKCIELIKVSQVIKKL